MFFLQSLLGLSCHSLCMFPLWNQLIPLLQPSLWLKCPVCPHLPCNKRKTRQVPTIFWKLGHCVSDVWQVLGCLNLWSSCMCELDTSVKLGILSWVKVEALWMRRRQKTLLCRQHSFHRLSKIRSKRNQAESISCLKASFCVISIQCLSKASVCLKQNWMIIPLRWKMYENVMSKTRHWIDHKTTSRSKLSLQD